MASPLEGRATVTDSSPGYTLNGAVAQLVERLLCKQDVVGSNPSGSTTLSFGGVGNAIED